MDELLLAPAPGLVVRDPIDMRPLEAAGEPKPASTYWLRRLAERDVVQLEAVSSAAERSTAE